MYVSLYIPKTFKPKSNELNYNLFHVVSFCIVLDPSLLNRPPSPSTTETDEETSYERSAVVPIFNLESIKARNKITCQKNSVSTVCNC